MQESQTLITRLKAISDENRFSLLKELRKPSTINQIELTAETSNQDYRGDRCLTRQGIQYHLDILREAGLVTARLENREGRRMNVHQVDSAGLYLFYDEVREFAGWLGENQPATERPTEELEDDGDRTWPAEPRLILTRGIRPGRAFSLSGKPSSVARGWVVGRSPKAEIPLTYDPFVSSEDAEIIPDQEGFRLLDLRSSVNRVRVNDRRLDCGAEIQLRRGDLIHVGRSTLLFQG